MRMKLLFLFFAAWSTSGVALGFPSEQIWQNRYLGGSEKGGTQQEAVTAPKAGDLELITSPIIRQEKIKRAAQWSWQGYRKQAWGHDEMGVSTDPLEPARARDFAFMGLTAVDAMDTFLLMGLHDEFKQARDWVHSSLDFDVPPVPVLVFEVNIRVLGGLLSTFYLGGGDPVLLEKAVDLGQRFLDAMDTTTGVAPSLFDISQKTTRGDRLPRLAGSNNCASAASMTLEMTTLSRITACLLVLRMLTDWVGLCSTLELHLYCGMLQVAWSSLGAAYRFWHLLPMIESCDGLYCNEFDGDRMACHEPQVVTTGAGSDSMYEYMLKQWALSGFKDEAMLGLYRRAMSGARRHLVAQVTPEDPAAAGSGGHFWILTPGVVSDPSKCGSSAAAPSSAAAVTAAAAAAAAVEAARAEAEAAWTHEAGGRRGADADADADADAELAFDEFWAAADLQERRAFDSGPDPRAAAAAGPIAWAALRRTVALVKAAVWPRTAERRRRALASAPTGGRGGGRADAADYGPMERQSPKGRAVRLSYQVQHLGCFVPGLLVQGHMWNVSTALAIAPGRGGSPDPDAPRSAWSATRPPEQQAEADAQAAAPQGAPSSADLGGGKDRGGPPRGLSAVLRASASAAPEAAKPEVADPEIAAPAPGSQPDPLERPGPSLDPDPGQSPDPRADPTAVDDLELAMRLMPACNDLYRSSLSKVAPDAVVWRSLGKSRRPDARSPESRGRPAGPRGKATATATATAGREGGGDEAGPVLYQRVVDQPGDYLRPEVLESLFFLWIQTRNEVYREWGWKIFVAFESVCRLDSGGYSVLDAADSTRPVRGDHQESFWLAETLKYLYLLFADPDEAQGLLSQYVLNTEAHPLPVWGSRAEASVLNSMGIVPVDFDPWQL